MLDLPKIWQKYMLIDETIYAGECVEQFKSDTMSASVTEDMRTGRVRESREVHQKATK